MSRLFVSFRILPSHAHTHTTTSLAEAVSIPTTDMLLRKVLAVQAHFFQNYAELVWEHSRVSQSQ